MLRSISAKADKGLENRHTIAAHLNSYKTPGSSDNHETDSVKPKEAIPSPLFAEKTNLLSETTTNFVFDMNNTDGDEEEVENFVSPSVRVKHSVTYEYDEKSFEISKDELLFLINKTNQDWWLCLRLDENLTFFVPASYLQVDF